MGSGVDLHILQIACQSALMKEGVCSGWLRGKTVLHKWGEVMDQKINRPGFADHITSLISWQKLYVVVSDGYLLIYNSETAKKPARVIDLCGFQRVEREEYLKVKDVPWPFKVTSELNNKIMYYGAMSEPEQKKWIDAVTKAIDEAKQSGRKPVIYEQKEAVPKPPTKRSDKPLPKAPSFHSTSTEDNDDNDDEDGLDDYDYIPDPIEEMQQESKQSAAFRSKLPPIPGKGADVVYEISSEKGLHQKAMPKPSVIGRRDIAVPPVPTENIETAPLGLKLKKVAQVSAEARSPPSPTPKKPTVPTPLQKPAVPVKNTCTVQPNLASKPVPQVPVGGKKQAEEEDDVEYETTDECIVKAATWTGSSEESVELMKSMKSEGVFMIRESTTGNGDLTLQVLSESAVRKYKIAKEGTKFQMGGGKTFDSMAELLVFYQNNSIPNRSTKLTKPFSRI